MKITRLNTAQELVKIELVIVVTPGELIVLKKAIATVIDDNFADVDRETEEIITDFLVNLNDQLF